MTAPAPEPFTLPVTLAAPLAALTAGGPDDGPDAGEAAGFGAEFVPQPNDATSMTPRVTIRAFITCDSTVRFCYTIGR